jgi:Golgi apparatus protein 1
MTHNVRFDDAATKQCAKDIKLLEDCNEHTDERGTGRLVSCLYDSLRNITEPSCRSFINQVQVVIFTDWRLSEYFANACMDDIIQLKCGRLDIDNETVCINCSIIKRKLDFFLFQLQHEQGGVVSCLTKSHNKLSKLCRKEILHLAEMQSDDYHLDRALYYACRGDRDRLCPNIISGNGRIYRCLYDQKFNTMLSPDVRNQ